MTVLRWMVSCLALALGLAAAQAQPAPEPRRVALVIGNGSYGLGPLRKAVENARSVADALRQASVDVVMVENGTLDAMQKGLGTFAAKIDPTTIAIVYFAGHAAPLNGRNYLIPVDAPVMGDSDLRREALSLEAVLDQLIVNRAEASLIVLDTAAPAPYPQTSATKGKGLAAIEAVPNVAIVTAAAPGRTWPEDRVGSLVASEFVKALGEKGATLGSVGRALNTVVARQSRRELVPTVVSGLKTDPAALPPAPVKVEKPADPIEISYWDSIRDSADAANFKAYLDAYPDGRYAEQARTRLASLTVPAGARPAAPTPAPATPAPVAAPTPAPAPATPVAPVANRAGAGTVAKDCEQCPEIVPIPAGAFAMGSDQYFDFERPVHQVVLRKAYMIGRKEVTFAEWDVCVAEGGCAHRPNDRGQGRGNRPVTDVSWTDAKAYTTWLSLKTGKPYRLPSESEWEYAARGGSNAIYPWGNTLQEERANCIGCTKEPKRQAIEVGSYPPNGYGLFDMGGNAAEWVEDCWNDSYRGAPNDGAAWAVSGCRERVLRGGSFNNDVRYLRTAARFKYDFDVRFYTNGFRVARDQ